MGHFFFAPFFLLLCKIELGRGGSKKKTIILNFEWIEFRGKKKRKILVGIFICVYGDCGKESGWSGGECQAICKYK